MVNMTLTNTTQITRVRFADPQIASRRLAVGVDGAGEGTGLSTFGFGPLSGLVADPRIAAVTSVPTFYAPTHKTLAVKDVAFPRAWSPPV